MLNLREGRSQGVVGRGNACLGMAYPLGKHEREKEIDFYFWKLCLLYFLLPEMDCFGAGTSLPVWPALWKVDHGSS